MRPRQLTEPAARSRREPQPNARVRLSLIGGFELCSGGTVVPLQPRAQRLVAFLALRDRSVQRQHLAGNLWLDSPSERALANLRSTLWRVRQAGCRVLLDLGQQIALDPQVEVDVRELVSVAHRLFDGGEPAAGWVLQMTQAGELLPDWDEDWVTVEREHLHQMRLHALEILCERLVSDGRFGWAVEACLAAVSGEPLRESAHRALIKAYLAEGNAGDAIAQYRSYRQLMLDELGLEPSSQMDDLVHDVVTAERR